MFRELFSKDKEPLPNKFTKLMGEHVRQAREEAGLSQSDLAKMIYRRQAAISDIENGRMEVTATTLMQLSFVLKKPLSYFFPEEWLIELPPERLSEGERELLIHVHRLNDDDLHRVIAQTRALADLADKKGYDNYITHITKK
jgi:transcriptional regulator with XRE-family HTH domain